MDTSNPLQDSAVPADVRQSMKTVLVVDDTKLNLTVMGELLQPHYRLRVATSGERALQVARGEPRPDLILLDIMMPGMDGYTVIQHLRADPVTRDIPVIFVTAMDEMEDEETGLNLGAVDYVAKPIRPAILLARVRNHLELKDARDRLKDQNAYLESEVARRTRENNLVKDVSLNALAMLAEKRDNETGNHLHRTQGYVEILMQVLAEHPRFRDALRGDVPELIAKATPLHDIGKVGIPDHILLKPGRLTAEEFEIMKQHSQIGAEAIDDAIKRVVGEAASQAENPFAFLAMARNVALYHHEKWDGSGYPKGLAGDEIPVGARLMALADVYDALMSRRHYKDAFPREKVLEIIGDGRGRHFDPDIVDAFFNVEPEFARVAREFSDLH